MADSKISDLSAAGSLTGAELVEAVQGGSNVKTTTQDIANLAAAGSGHVIEDEGTPLTQRSNLNFVGAGVSAADAGGKTVVTIPDGGAGKQNTLVSGTNIKTIDGVSILGSGDIDLAFVESVSGDGVDNSDPLNPVLDLSDYLLDTLTANPQSVDYAFQESDFDGQTEVQLTGTVAKNFTINALSGVPVGRTVYIRRLGASATPLITIVAGSGQTVNTTRGVLTDPGRYVLMALTKTATDTWLLDNGVAFTISSSDVTGALGFTPVTNARTIAGLDLTANRTVTEVKTALNSWLKVVKTGTTTNNTTSFVDITDLSFTIPANTEYEIMSVIYYSSSNTSEGASIGINGPTLTSLNYNTRRTTSATASSERWGTSAYDTDVASVTSLATGNVSFGMARLQTSASGTVIMRLAAETGAATITVLAGSYIQYRPLTGAP